MNTIITIGRNKLFKTNIDACKVDLKLIYKIVNQLLNKNSIIKQADGSTKYNEKLYFSKMLQRNQRRADRNNLKLNVSKPSSCAFHQKVTTPKTCLSIYLFIYHINLFISLFVYLLVNFLKCWLTIVLFVQCFICLYANVINL